GTENLMMAAVLAEGETILENAAQEPEVVDLANMLIAMGARIKGHGTEEIVIQGVDKLHGTTHHIMPDRIETGTFLCAVGATQGDITLHQTQADTLEATLHELQQAGLEIRCDDRTIHARMRQRAYAVRFSTLEY